MILQSPVMMILPLFSGVALEAQELGIADRLEEEPQRPDCGADEIQRPERSARSPVDEHQGIGDDEEEETLEEKDLEIAPEDEQASPIPAATSHSGSLRRRFRLRMKIWAASLSPHTSTRPETRRCPGAVGRAAEKKLRPADQDEPQTPADVDHGIVLADQGDRNRAVMETETAKAQVVTRELMDGVRRPLIRLERPRRLRRSRHGRR